MKRATLVGLSIAPLTPLIALIAIAFISDGKIPEIFGGAMLVLPISYLTSFIIGAPLVYLLRRRQMNSLIHYAIAGAFASLLPIFIVIIYPLVAFHDESSPAQGWTPSHAGISLAMILSGLLVAAAFWVITRPDRLQEGNLAPEGQALP